MRRWLEVLLVLVCVAAGARLFVPGRPAPKSQEPAKITNHGRQDSLGGYAIVGSYPEMYSSPAEGISGSIGPSGIHRWGKELSRDSKVILRTGDLRDKVIKELGKPVGYNSDNTKWGYWTRGLPNPKMGILIRFNKQNEIEQIDLASDWSKLATEMALDSIPAKR